MTYWQALVVAIGLVVYTVSTYGAMSFIDMIAKWAGKKWSPLKHVVWVVLGIPLLAALIWSTGVPYG